MIKKSLFVNFAKVKIYTDDNQYELKVSIENKQKIDEFLK